MKRVEDFLHEYFRERTEMHRSLGQLHSPLAARFFTPTYVFFDHEKSIADSEAESILSVQASDGMTEVITKGWLGASHRIRYRLSAAADSWQITAIEIECGVCHSSGKQKGQQEDCRICKGKGWTLIGKTKDT